MVNALVAAKARALIPLTTDSQGLVSAERLQSVVRELLNSNHQSKRQIVRQLAVLAENLQVQQLAEVTTAVELPKTTQDELANLVRKRHPQVKQFTWNINAELLGGFTIKVADTWYDTSVAADLQAIREKLSQ